MIQRLLIYAIGLLTGMGGAAMIKETIYWHEYQPIDYVYWAGSFVILLVINCVAAWKWWGSRETVA